LRQGGASIVDTYYQPNSRCRSIRDRGTDRGSYQKPANLFWGGKNVKGTILFIAILCLILLFSTGISTRGTLEGMNTFGGNSAVGRNGHEDKMGAATQSLKPASNIVASHQYSGGFLVGVQGQNWHLTVSAGRATRVTITDHRSGERRSYALGEPWKEDPTVVALGLESHINSAIRSVQEQQQHQRTLDLQREAERQRQLDIQRELERQRQMDIQRQIEQHQQMDLHREIERQQRDRVINPPTEHYTPPVQHHSPPTQHYTPPVQHHSPPTQHYSPPGANF